MIHLKYLSTSTHTFISKFKILKHFWEDAPQCIIQSDKMINEINFEEHFTLQEKCIK